MTGRRPRVLVVTRLFPNVVEPNAAPFVRQQVVALSRLCDVELMAVVPWFPGARFFARWSASGRRTAVPARAEVAGLPVLHPRVLYLPKLHALAPALYVASLLPHLRGLRGRVDVVLGCWAFPDGVAAVALARLLGVPAVVKVHGSDLNVIGARQPARALLRAALPRARRVVAVSRALAARAMELGVAPDRVAVVRNGVDRELFHPRDRELARQALAATGSGFPPGTRGLLFVGHLLASKGLGELLEAFARLAARRPELALAILGDGPEVEHCRQVARAWNGRLVVAGARPLSEVATWIAASDVVVLPSWSEGTPNVVLEAMASGRPVVASNVGGIPEMICSEDVGELVPPRAPEALAAALERAIDRHYDPASIARAAPGSWSESASQLLAVLESAINEGAAGVAAFPSGPREALSP